MKEKQTIVLNNLRTSIVGQNKAVERLSDLLLIGLSGLNAGGRPALSVIMAGPTGCGKTHVALSVAKALHGVDGQVLRIDCAEFQHSHEIAKLIGAPPGYLGHRETQPTITQHRLAAVSSERSPLSVVLFDEIEKAHPSMFRILLGVLDTAQLRLGDGTLVNFERACVFFTSNLGHGSGGSIGLGCTGRHSRVASAINDFFSAEFLNRVDAIIPFDNLSQPEILDIAKREIDAAVGRYARQGYIVSVPTGVVERVAELGYSHQYGAREVRRVIEREITLRVARLGCPKVCFRLKRGEITAKSTTQTLTMGAS